MDSYTLAKTIVQKLAKSGYTAYFAGGWVRDYVMGHPSEDIDIATNAAPVEIMNLFPNTILVGLSFGVVIVVLEGHQFEVATFRKDLPYVDGRHPLGIEMSTPEEDALRRDFTINGMFYDPIEETLHDFVHGREDIKRGIIRTIGNPEERFFEDRLRMLRAFRFAARLSFAIDHETQEAIRDNADKLFPAVAMERVWQEFNKMASFPRFDQAILDMHRLSILEIIFPELRDIHLNDLRHQITHFPRFPQECPTILYVMELFPQASLAEKIDIGKRLKASNKDLKLLEYVQTLFDALEKEEKGELPTLHDWSHLMAHNDFQLALEVYASRKQGEDRLQFLQKMEARGRKLAKHVARLKLQQPLVTSTMLKEAGVPASKLMGALLNEAEKIAIERDLQTPEEALFHLKKHPLWPESAA